MSSHASAEVYDLSTPPGLVSGTRSRLEAQRPILEQRVRSVLRRLLRLGNRVQFESVQMLRARRIESLVEPGSWWVSGGSHGQPEEKTVFLAISPSLAYASIDRTFGGDGDSNVPDRPASEIETRFGNAFLSRLLEELAQALAEPPLRLQVTEHQPLPEPLSLFLRDAEEPLICLPFQIELKDTKHRALLCLSRTLLAGPEPRTEPKTFNAQELHPAVGQAPTMLEAELARCQLSISEAAELAVGDVVLFDDVQGKPVDLNVDGSTRFRARLGQYHHRYAVEVLEVVQAREATENDD